MSRTHVGVRELKARLSEYLRRVKAGETVVITERGQEIGRIIPGAQPVQARVQAMVEAGLAAWSGRRLERYEPAAAAHGDRTVAELLIEDRE